MNFAELAPSQEWASLKYRGEPLAGVWFKPEGEPNALWLRIPRSSFDIPGLGQQLTPKQLLRAVGIAVEEVESWYHVGDPESDWQGSGSDLGQPLPAPPEEVDHLHLYLKLKAPIPVEEAQLPVGETQEIPEATWQYLEGRWNAILNVESSIEALRLSSESLRSNMESSASKSLALEEKVNALSGDLVTWTKAKNRIRYSVPKLREFIHRATWAASAAERKQVEDYFKNHVEPRIPLPDIDQVVAQFDMLLKNRQILSAQGVLVQQEGKSILSEVDGSLRTLLRNAASKAASKKSITGKNGKYY